LYVRKQKKIALHSEQNEEISREKRLRRKDNLYLTGIPDQQNEEISYNFSI
jgi:hypothetical protein